MYFAFVRVQLQNFTETNLEPRVSPALCQRLVAGRNSGIFVPISFPESAILLVCASTAAKRSAHE